MVFIHGVVNDHSVWILQSRYLAHHGWNVLALDLPGHCRSAGDAPSSVEEAADFIGGVLDAVGVQRAALVGHSWGSLIALEAAARPQDRTSHLANVGDCRSLVIHPASTTHFRMTDEALAGAGIGPGTIRLSIGLEDPADLIDDLKRALKAAEKAAARAGGAA